MEGRPYLHPLFSESRTCFWKTSLYGCLSESTYLPQGPDTVDGSNHDCEANRTVGKSALPHIHGWASQIVLEVDDVFRVPENEGNTATVKTKLEQIVDEPRLAEYMGDIGCVQGTTE